MDNSRYKKLTLLHSNDLHGDFLAEDVSNELVGGVSMLSGYISKVKEEEKNVIYCIAGDMFRGSVIDSEYLGYSTIEIMNMLAPDVVTIGNHETDYGLSHLLFLEKCAQFPIINANLYININGKRLFKPYHIIEIDGMKILFIGIITEDVLNTAGNEKIIGSLVDIYDAAKEIEKICNTFKGVDIDFTVLLTHIGFEQDKKLAAELDPALGVDVIVGGHSHTLLEKPCEINNILIVQAGIGTDQIGRFDIIIDTDTNDVESYTWKTIPIVHETCPDDPKMEDLVTRLKNQTDMKYGRTIRRLNCELKHESRYKQTTLGHFLSDIYTLVTKSDLCLLTSGCIRTPKLGPVVTLNDMMECYPYDDTVIAFKLRGKDIKSLFKYICRDEVFKGDAHEFYQVSKDWDIIYDTAAHELEHIRYKNEDLKDDQLIKVVLTDYDYNNFEKFFGLPTDTIIEPKKVITSSREMIYEYMENGEIMPEYPEEGRLIVK